MNNTDKEIQRHFIFLGRTRNLPWYPRRGNRNDLAKLFGKLSFNTGVEIGTQRGYFAIILCEANPALRLTCVDPWIGYDEGVGNVTQERQDGIYAQAVENLKNRNVSILRKTSIEGAKEFQDETLDFVYIDGNHLFDFAIQDILAWVPKVKKGGIVALHDYHHQVGADVVAAINAYTHCHGINPWYITREEFPTAFWVKK